MTKRRPYHIHITGAARSGTTLMLALMLTCFEIDGGVAEETRLWRAPLRGRRIVCTKQPNDEALSFFLARVDPELHVIYMLRDPRDVIVSTHGSAPGRYWTTLRAWRDSVRRAKPLFSHPRIHLVRYDELSREPDQVQRKLAAAMPFLKSTRAFSRFADAAKIETPQWQRAMGSIRPVAAESIGSWRTHLPRLKAQILRHGSIAGDLIELGFEPDSRWLSVLDGVSPDQSESRMSEQPGLRRRFNNAWRDSLGAVAYLAKRLA